MKLFQKLLLAPTALGLFAPIAASASEANLMDVSSYSQVDVEVTQDTFKPLSTKNPLLAGGEGLGADVSNDFDADSFSSTTSASFTSNWIMGAVDGVSAQEKVGATYDWEVALTTSFNGNDSLDVSLEAGEGGATLTEMDLHETGDAIHVASIGYTRPIGDYLTVNFSHGGQGTELFNTACVYTGQTKVLEDCANAVTGMDFELGTAASATVDVGNGLSFSFGYEGENNSDGLMTDEAVDAYGFQVAYIKDNFGVSYSAGIGENHVDGVLTGGETEAQAFNAYFTPDLDSFPSISFGIEWTDNNNIADSNADETSQYFIGAQFNDLGNGTLGVAVGSKEATIENADSETMYEAYYAYNYADGITITPVIYVKEEDTAGTDDETGIILKTTFEF